MRILLPLSLITLSLSGCYFNQTIKHEKPTPTATPATIAVAKNTDFYIEKYKQDPNETKIQIGRYTEASATATQEQQDLLSVVIQTTIPSEVKTVGEAISFLLLRSGFELAENKRQGKFVPQLLSKSLPYAHRKLGPITLKDALLIIVGDAYWMKVDPVHRLVAFDTINEFM